MSIQEQTINSIKQMLKEKGKMPPGNMWPDPILDTDTVDVAVDLTEGLSGPAFDYVRASSDLIGFPRGSGMIVSMGMVAMLAAYRNVRVRAYHHGGDRLVTLYAAIGLGSGEGKSGFYKSIFGPFNKITKAMEDKKEKNRRELFEKLNSIDEEIKILKAANKDKNVYSMAEYKDLMSDRDKVKESLDVNKPVLWNLDQFNNQAAANAAIKQDGFIPIHSDEPDSIGFITAETVGLKTSLYRKAWDGAQFTYGKVDDQINIDSVLASICLLGQEGIYERIVNSTWDPETGESVGNAERWIAWIDPSTDGEKRSKVYGEPPSDLMVKAWRRIIFNMINLDKGFCLTMSDKAIKELRETFFNYDDRCKPGDVFSTAPIKGFVHKCEAHIANIASVIHIMKHMIGDTGDVMPREIEDETVNAAKRIFAKVVKNNMIELKRMGHAGIEARANEVKDSLSSIVSKNRCNVLPSSKIQQGCAAKATFRKGKKLTAHEMYRDIYPALEKMNIIAVVGKTVYVNPKFA